MRICWRKLKHVLLPLVFLSDSSIFKMHKHVESHRSTEIETGTCSKTWKGKLGISDENVGYQCRSIVVTSCEVHRFSGTDGMMRMICQGTCSLSCTSWKAYEPKEKNGCYMFDWSESSLNHGHDFEDVPPQDVMKYMTIAVCLNTCPCTWHTRLSCLIAFLARWGLWVGSLGFLW